MEQFCGTTFAARIGAAFKDADCGSGLSDVLFDARFQGACEILLESLPAEHRAQALALAVAQGYDPNNDADRDFAPGACSMTGIDAKCCSCGRHP